MFTGIIQTIGKITQLQPHANGAQLDIACTPEFLQGISLGDSIAIQGACMTVTAFRCSPNATEHNVFCIDVSAESLSKTAGLLTLHQAVNLEKALRLSDFIGGHLVSGHVDGTATVLLADITPEGAKLALKIPAEFMPFMVYKGSVTINGVSLTVNQVIDYEKDCTIELYLIPHTVRHTTLQYLTVGDQVNLEIDLMARHFQRFLKFQNLEDNEVKAVETVKAVKAVNKLDEGN